MSSQTQPPEVVIGNYKIKKTIGQGTYGKVKLGLHMATAEKVAIKIIEKSQIQSSRQVTRLQREIRLLKLLNHPHIVKVYEVIETAEYIYIIMEYASGGELFDYIVSQKRVKDKEAKFFFRMIISAVEYCHRNAVIHRDLKPENLLLDDRKWVKIIDFGFGNTFGPALLNTFCGSPFYAAPEMILGKAYRGPEVDMWSLGVVLFALLCGHLPFDDENMKELYRKISVGIYVCPDHVKPNARHLITRLITVDPLKRATLDEVLCHPWLNEGYAGPPPNYIPKREPLNVANLNKEIVDRLIVFGYSKESIYLAIIDNAEYCPIRSTYYLIDEMLKREAKVKAEQQSNSPLVKQVLQPERPSIVTIVDSDSDSELEKTNDRDSTAENADGMRFPDRAYLFPYPIKLNAPPNYAHKNPSEIIQGIVKCLNQHPGVIRFWPISLPREDCKFGLACEVDVAKFLGITNTQHKNAWTKPLSKSVTFQVRAERKRQNELIFTRIEGELWEYKYCCESLVQKLQ